MLPVDQRLTQSAEFAATVRLGRRAGRPRLVVHLRPVGHGHPVDGSQPGEQRPEPGSPAPGVVVCPGSARVGLVVSKAVGNAVVRHRVSRRLRHVMAPLVPGLAAGTSVVLRALPAAGKASSAELAADVASALRRLGVLDPAP